MTNLCPQEFIALANRLADVARPVALGYFRKEFTIEDKADDSPVTIADRTIEKEMRAVISAEQPTHGVLGEEFGLSNGDADWIWVLDPIDGTKSFITGKPLFGTLISLTFKGKPILGIIDHAALDERWVGAVGCPTTHNGKTVTTRVCDGVKNALLYATSPHMFAEEDGTFARFEVLRKAVKHPLYGADCYGYGLLASGWADIVCEASLGTYDYCALVPVIEGAGGVMTDWHGNGLTLRSDGKVLAAGDGKTHAEALSLLEAP